MKRKILRMIFAVSSYLAFFLLIYSILLNIIFWSTKLLFDNGIIDLWELVFIPIIILFEIKFYRPNYPHSLCYQN